MAEPFDIKKWFSGWFDPVTWGKAFIYIGIFFVLVAVKNFIIPPKTNVSKPTNVIMPFAKLETGAISQPTTQTTIEKEKSFEVGGGVAGMRYDNKDGVMVGIFGKYRF